MHALVLRARALQAARDPDSGLACGKPALPQGVACQQWGLWNPTNRPAGPSSQAAAACRHERNTPERWLLLPCWARRCWFSLLPHTHRLRTPKGGARGNSAGTPSVTLGGLPAQDEPLMACAVLLAASAMSLSKCAKQRARKRPGAQLSTMGGSHARFARVQRGPHQAGCCTTRLATLTILCSAAHRHPHPHPHPHQCHRVPPPGTKYTSPLGGLS
eukprot:SAG31_NODE_4828_length_2921_cov_1.564139_1_plen_216_part_00